MPMRNPADHCLGGDVDVCWNAPGIFTSKERRQPHLEKRPLSGSDFRNPAANADKDHRLWRQRGVLPDQGIKVSIEFLGGSFCN